MQKNNFSGITKRKLTVPFGVVLFLLLAFIIQGFSIYFLFLDLLTNALILHVLSASLFPFALYQLLPVPYRQNKVIFSFLFLMCWLVPVVSGIGLLLSLSMGLYYTKPIEVEVTRTVHAEDLPEDILQSVQLAQYNEGSVIGILESSSIEEQRIKAVLNTRQMTDQEAIPILKMALLDPVDEVRLLAYSMLDKKEKNIGHAIHQQIQTLDNSASNPVRVHLRLAESYWELSYLGLVTGQAKLHVLNDAYEQIKLAIKMNTQDGATYFLQARIALALNDYKVAELSLKQALALGMNFAQVAPYQAELAFVTRQFDKIEQYIGSIDKTAKDNDVMAEVVKQWG